MGSKKHLPIESETTSKSELRKYSSRYGGGILLACRKCQRKLRDSSDASDLAKLKKSLKKLARQHGTEPIHVLSVPCLKLCPKDAVTVCTQGDLRSVPPSLTLIRTAQDIVTLYEECTEPAGPGPGALSTRSSTQLISA